MIPSSIDLAVETCRLPQIKRSPSTILLVDDDVLVRHTLRAIIEHAGYAVIAAADGQQAIEISKSGHFEMLITDFEMPDMNGFLLAERLTERQPQLPVLIISGTASVHLPLKEIVYRDWNYLSKPVNRLRLFETIDENCGFGKSRPTTH